MACWLVCRVWGVWCCRASSCAQHEWVRSVQRWEQDAGAGRGHARLRWSDAGAWVWLGDASLCRLRDTHDSWHGHSRWAAAHSLMGPAHQGRQLSTEHLHGGLGPASFEACSQVTAGTALCLHMSMDRALPAQTCYSPMPPVAWSLLCCPAAHATPGRDSAWNSSDMLPAHTPAEPDEFQGQGHLPTPLSNSAGAQPTPTPQSHGATPFRASAVAGGVLGPYAQVRLECDPRPNAPLQAALLQAVVLCCCCDPRQRLW